MTRRTTIRRTRRTHAGLQASGERRCGGCEQPLLGRHGKKYCDGKCRAMAHRVRKAQEAREILQTLKDKLAELEELVSRK